MFLNLLTERQKQSFLALATKVVMADGNVVPEESVTLDVRVAEMGGAIKAPPEEIYGVPNYDIFDTPRARLICVLELLVIAYSDDEFHVDERPIIHQLVEVFGYSPVQMEAFEAWARKQAPLSVEGWDFIVAAEGKGL